MAFTLPQVPFKLSAEDMGAPDMVTAIANGLKAGFLPRQLPVELAQKIADTRSKNAYAMLLAPQMAERIAKSDAFKYMSQDQRDAIMGLLGSVTPDMLNNQMNYTSGGYNTGNSGMNYQTTSQPITQPNVSGANDIGDPQQVIDNFEKKNASNDYASNKADFERTASTGEAQGKGEGQSMADLETKAAETTKNAQNLGISLDQFHEKYKQSLLKGPVLGYLAKFGTTAGELDPISSELQINLANELLGSKVSNMGRTLIGGSKLNKMMTSGAEQGSYNRNIASANRARYMNDFVQNAKELGMNNAQDIQELWFNFNNDLPFYDLKTGKPINQQLSKSQMKNYIKQKIGNNQSDNDSSESIKNRYKRVNGRLVKE